MAELTRQSGAESAQSDNEAGERDRVEVTEQDEQYPLETENLEPEVPLPPSPPLPADATEQPEAQSPPLPADATEQPEAPSPPLPEDAIELAEGTTGEGEEGNGRAVSPLLIRDEPRPKWPEQALSESPSSSSITGQITGAISVPGNGARTIAKSIARTKAKYRSSLPKPTRTSTRVKTLTKFLGAEELDKGGGKKKKK